MSPPRTTRHRCAVALALGVAATLSVSMFCAFRSAAAQRTAWLNVVPRAGGLAFVGHDRSAGKSIITWAPLSDAEQAAFEATGEYGPSKIGAGAHVPPTWSSFHAPGSVEPSVGAGPFAKVRIDIGVGWPFRAFACTTGAADPARVDGGVALPIMGADQGLGYLIAEVRAVPLRPIWAGLFGDVAFFSLGAYAMLICWTVRERRVAKRPAGAAWSLRKRVAVCGVLGLACSVCTGVVMPLALRERSVTVASTTRAGAYLIRDFCWSRRTARLSPEEAKALTPHGASALDVSLASLTYSTDPARRARTQAAVAHSTGTLGPSAPEPPGTTFTSVTTGWPFACLWGASWQRGDEPEERAGMRDLPKLAGIAGVLNRGVNPFPTRVHWAGWLENCGCFGGVFFVVGWAVRRRSATRPLATLASSQAVRRAA